MQLMSVSCVETEGMITTFSQAQHGFTVK